MPNRIVICGAGFGGLELAARLSDALRDEAEITLIDQNDGFVFGFSKFELMFGRATLDEVTHRYRDLLKPGVRFQQETITAIDPTTRRVTTDHGVHESDILVIALGAEYDPEATPGFVEGGHEFYSIPGAIALHDVLRAFSGGHVLIGVLGEPFKCPPAPCEAVMLLDDWLSAQGRREATTIALVHPWGLPVPPSPDGSQAILSRFTERGIAYRGDAHITHLDPSAQTAHLQGGDALPYDLFLGIPQHRVPAVVTQSGLTEDGWIPVDADTLATRWAGVYAIGDVTSAPVPKAGVFAESAARAVAQHIIDQVRGSATFERFDGRGACYVEFGGGMVGRVDADFRSGPTPTAPFAAPSADLVAEKAAFASSRRLRWFGG